MKDKIRKAINRDDGKWFQVGNYNLSGLEIIGGIFMIACFIGLALAQHTLDQLHKYMSIGIGIIGIILYGYGNFKNKKDRKGE